MTFNTGVAYNQAQILSYGGNRAQMYALAEFYDIEIRGWGGVASFPSVIHQGSINVNGVVRRVYRMIPNFNRQTWAVMLNTTNSTVANGSWNYSQNQIRAIVLHELGHLMGYYGHSRDNRDIMHLYVANNIDNNNLRVSESESRHLRRVYDRFRI